MGTESGNYFTTPSLAYLLMLKFLFSSQEINAEHVIIPTFKSNIS